MKTLKYTLFFIALAIMSSCTKKEDVSNLATLPTNEILKNVSIGDQVAFFELAKGDTIVKEIMREKPDSFDDDNEQLLKT
jgi:hypothetical protein